MRKQCFLIFLFSIFLLKAHAGNTQFQISLDDYINGAPIVVPKGNRNANSAKGFSSSHKSKYKKIVRLISQKKNICVVKQASELYKVDPVAIMGSIIGEHTYNVDSWDVGQDTVMWMVNKWISRFENEGQSVQSMLAEDKYAQCLSSTNNNFDLWNCYDSVWKTDSRNYRRNKRNWELKWTFFNPVGAGYTYGFGQLGPVRALMVTDLVHEVSGFDLLTVEHPPSLYDAILNPQTSIHYVAASNRKAIDLYLEQANFDISQNPGVIATLYNLGREQRKVNEKYQQTVDRLQAGQAGIYPSENYYGWFVNWKESEIRGVYQEAAQQCN
jgi:hypothetical protein